jgi:hypothetical protein
MYGFVHIVCSVMNHLHCIVLWLLSVSVAGSLLSAPYLLET